MHQIFSQSPLPSLITTHRCMMVIWKGLHNAMLHQPQPLLQEELADKISNMIYCFKKEKHVNLFVQAAMETFEREWHHVNTFMVDKMMMFFRRVIRQAFFRLADQKWRHSDMFMKMLEEVVIRPLDDDHKFKVDVKMHLSSLFLEELAKAHNEHFTHSTLMIFIQPFIKVISVSRDPRYVADVHCSIFQYLIRQSDVGVDSRSNLQENEILVKKNGKPVNPSRRRPSQESDEEDEVMNDYEDGEQGWEDMDSNEEDCEDSDEEDGEEEEEEEAENGELEEEEEAEDGELEEEEAEDEEDDEEEEEEDDEDEQEGEDDEEDEDEEEEVEYPLDPRAGNVDVLLPQIVVDYESFANTLVDIMESEASNIRPKNLRKVRTLIRQLQDVVGNVYPLTQHPTVHPVHKLLKEDVADVDVDKAIQKRMDLYEEEFKADPKLKKDEALTMEELEELYAKASKTKNILQKERAHKWIALNLKKRQYEKRKEELKFKKYAKRTIKLKSKVDNRRLKALGMLLSAEDKQKELQIKNEGKRQALLGVIATVTKGTQVGPSAANACEAPSTKACKTVPSSAASPLTTDAASDNKGTVSSQKLLKESAKKAVTVKSSEKEPKTLSLNDPQVVATEIRPKKSMKTASPKTSLNVMVTTKVTSELPRKIAGAKRSRSVDQAPVKAAKKVKTLDASKKISSLASPSPSKKVKKNATTPTSIKINLGHNKQHDYHDYQRSIQASPAIPFQPDRTPLSSVLKATNSPILVKKPFSKTLKSIPTNAKFEGSSPLLKQKTMQKSKKIKVSPHILKGLQKKGLSLEGLASKNKSPKLEINVKEKSLKSPKVTSAKPLAKKHSYARPSAADFF